MKTSPILAIAATIGVITTVVLFFSPTLCLLMLAALVPLERFGRFTDDTSEFTISLMRIAGIIVLGVFCLRRTLDRQGIVLDKTFFIYLGYCVLVAVSIVYSSDTIGSIRGTASVLANILFFFLIINLIDTRKVAIQALIVWLCVSTSIGVYSIYDWHLGSGQNTAIEVSDEFDPTKGIATTANRWSTVWHDTAELEVLAGKSVKRTMGSTSHSAVYGINLILTIPFLLLFLRLSQSRLNTALILGAMAIIAYNILLTNTRATILLSCITGVMCWYKGLFRITLPFIILGTITCSIAGFFLIPEDIFNRIFDSSNYTFENSASLRIRQEYLHAGAKAFFDSWFLGHGATNDLIIPAYVESWSNAPNKTTVHNEYLQTLIELGVVGALFLFSFIGILLKYCYNIERRLRTSNEMKQELMLANAIKISMLSTLIYGLQVDVFHFPLKGWWLIAGITVFLHKFSINYTRHPIPKTYAQQ